MKKTTSAFDLFDAATAQQGMQGREIPLSLIRRDPEQPRTQFGGPDDEELEASIRESGLAQPLVVRPDPDAPESFILVVGERRFNAAARAGLEVVACWVRAGLTPAEVVLLQLVENLNRSNLQEMDTARGLLHAKEVTGLSQADLARKLGKDPSWVSQHLALLRAGDETRSAVEQGRISGPLNAAKFEALPKVKRQELLGKKGKITRRDIEAAEATAPRRATSAAAASHSETPDRGSAEVPARRGRPPIERRISASLHWITWTRLFERLGAKPPADPSDLERALHALALDSD